MEELYGSTRPGGHTGDDRPPRYVEVAGPADDQWGNETVVYRASGWKECDIAFVAGALGMERSAPPQFLLDAFKEGDEYEPLILARLSNGPAVDLYGGGQVAVRVDERVDGEQIRLELELGHINDRRVIVRMHLDGTGIASWLGNEKITAGVEAPVVIEVKKLGPDYWRKFVKGGYRAIGLYDAQVSAQMHGSGKPVLFVCGEKTKTGLGKVMAEIITEPPIPLREFRKTAAKREAMIEQALAGGGLPECTVQQFPCAYWYTHTDTPETAAKAEARAARVEGDGELAGLVAEERAWDLAKKETAEKHRAAKDALAQWLETRGAKETGAVATVGDQTYDVTWTRVEKKAYTVAATVQEYVTVKARKVKAETQDPFDGVNGGKGTELPAPVRSGRRNDSDTGPAASSTRVIL